MGMDCRLMRMECKWIRRWRAMFCKREYMVTVGLTLSLLISMLLAFRRSIPTRR